MTPYAENYEFETEREQTTKTYRIDTDKNRIVGYTDGVNAMKQAVLLILNTQRFKHGVFSWNYGNELHKILGLDYELAKSEAKRLISEALLQDERITDVSGFSFEKIKNSISVSFDVVTIFGELDNVEVSL